MITLWPLLLPAAAWSGWVVALRHHAKNDINNENKLSKEYVVGLNYLLNEQQDKAVDIFIKLLEVDSDTVETHLALGSLFRRRGEVDRAIRLHQNLIARPQLSFHERKEALMALAQDYLSAGFFDRAEQIFIEALELGGDKDRASLQGLLAIYQQEKAWENALDIAKQIETITHQSMYIHTAHYYCEIAEIAIKSNNFEKAQDAIAQALQIDTHSVRASLLKADLAIKNKHYEQAIIILKTAIQQDQELISAIITPLSYCYMQVNAMHTCVEFLLSIIDEHPRASSLFIITEHIKTHNSTEEAIEFLSHQLKKYPSIQGLNRLIDLHIGSTHGKVREKLQILFDITKQFLINKPIYRCKQCGFGGKHLHWQCPSCKQWSTTKPIHGLEGD